MNSEHPSHQPQSPEAPQPAAREAMSADALQRRRALIKGLGKGSAVVAAAVPIKTLANPGFSGGGGPKLCTVSGMQSNVGSGRTGVNTDNCRGYSPGHFFNQGPPVTHKNWPLAPLPAAKFFDVFGGGPDLTLLEVLASGTDDAIWVAALLTAALVPQPAGFNFPYKPSEVVAFYTGPLKSDAFTFFMTYVGNEP